MKPYEVRELVKPNTLQRIAKKQPTKNTIIEINNYLAKNIPNIKIIDIEFFSDGLGINKDVGKNVYLEFNDDSEIVFKLLKRLIQDFKK